MVDAADIRAATASRKSSPQTRVLARVREPTEQLASGQSRIEAIHSGQVTGTSAAVLHRSSVVHVALLFLCPPRWRALSLLVPPLPPTPISAVSPQTSQQRAATNATTAPSSQHCHTAHSTPFDSDTTRAHEQLRHSDPTDPSDVASGASSVAPRQESRSGRRRQRRRRRLLVQAGRTVCHRPQGQPARGRRREENEGIHALLGESKVSSSTTSEQHPQPTRKHAKEESCMRTNACSGRLS